MSYLDPEDPRGNNLNGKPAKSVDEAAAHLSRSNDSINGLGIIGQSAVVTYAFRTSSSDPSFSTFDASQVNAAQLAMDAWEDVANINFEEKSEAEAVILFGNISEYELDQNGNPIPDGNGGFKPGRIAFASLPHAHGSNDDRNSDIWINIEATDNLDVSLLSRGYQNILHELGHALGLDHPGDYNYSSSVNLAYPSDAEYVNDSLQYTIMSYFGEENTGANFSGGSSSRLYASSPMMDDIAAMQRLIGSSNVDYFVDRQGLSDIAAGAGDDRIKLEKFGGTVDGGTGYDTLDLTSFSNGLLFLAGARVRERVIGDGGVNPGALSAVTTFANCNFIVGTSASDVYLDGSTNGISVSLGGGSDIVLQAGSGTTIDIGANDGAADIVKVNGNIKILNAGTEVEAI